MRERRYSTSKEYEDYNGEKYRDNQPNQWKLMNCGPIAGEPPWYWTRPSGIKAENLHPASLEESVTQHAVKVLNNPAAETSAWVVLEIYVSHSVPSLLPSPSGAVDCIRYPLLYTCYPIMSEAPSKSNLFAFL
ncbi:hypothetical protein STEG23_030635 [Scotinomys teguina]